MINIGRIIPQKLELKAGVIVHAAGEDECLEIRRRVRACGGDCEILMGGSGWVIRITKAPVGGLT